MPPPPPPPHFSSAAAAAIFLILFTASTVAHTCFLNTLKSQCPPFNSPPPFPFSAFPGCGHPNFQIKCSSPFSTISIDDLSFYLLHYEPNSSAITISPQPTSPPTETTTVATAVSPTSTGCSSSRFPSIPTRSINLSGSPFKVSDSSCSRLSVLKSCRLPYRLNCSHCQWDCKLVKNPAQLLHGCGSAHHAWSEQGCQVDILEHLDSVLKFGITVEWDEVQDSYFTSCRDCESENGVCGFNSSDPNKHFICFHSQSRFSPPLFRHENPNRITIFCLIFALMCLLLVISIATAIFRSKRLKFNSSTEDEDPNTVFLRRHRSASLLPPVFTYEELETSTNNFDPKRKLGDGGFGSVFLGQLYDNRIVAVKYLHKHHRAATLSTKSFCNEILILSSINHPNLVKLHGYCSDPRGLILVYDYVPNGTLADHLHGPKSLDKKGSLTWQVRIDIAIQTAMAIEYLHFCVEPAVVHRDITSSNIFVEKDMRIKVGDFGLSRLLIFPEKSSSSSSGSVWTGPQGTPGYLDPDYHRSFRLTEKSDVYSFGVVLLELISGLKAVDLRREKRDMALADMVVSKILMGLLPQVVDPFLAVDGEASDGVGAVAELAFRCVAADKDDRPDSREVVQELKRIRSRSCS